MTADTYSTTLGVLLMGTGNDNNTWGANQNNAVFQILEDAIANVLTTTVSGGTLDLSGSPPPAAPSQVRFAALIFNGTLGAGQTVIVPNLPKFWWVQNSTSGAFAMQLQATGGAAVAIPQNSGWQLVYCDGATNIIVMPFNSVQVLMPDGSAAAPSYSNVNEPSSGWYRFGAGNWRISILGTDAIQVSASGIIITGNLSFTGAFGAGDGTVSAPGLSFTNEPGTGLYRIGLGQFGAAVLEANVGIFTSTGFSWANSTFAGSDLTPASISSIQNNYNPPGLGLILTLGAITGGTLYADGTYTDVPLTGGTGTGARASIVVAGGSVASVTLTKRGLAFVAGDSLSASDTNIGGTGSGFSIPVSTVDALTGSCLRLNVTAACSLTGLAGGAAGREIELLNVGTATLQCPANSGSSTTSNRFANTFNIAPGQSITLRYDATSSLWRPKNVATAVSSCAIAAVSPDLLIVNDAVSPTTKRDITCSEATLIDAFGNAIKFELVSVSIDYTTTGAGGCDVGTRGPNTNYFEWLISDGVNINGLTSTSGTFAGLALPANYIYGKRVGGNFTDGASNLLRVRQGGQRAQYVFNPATSISMRPMITGVHGSVTAPTWTAVAIAGFAPSTASSIMLAMGNTGANSGDISMAAPNNSYGAYNSSTNPPPLVVPSSSTGDVRMGDFLIESGNIYYAGAQADCSLFIRGWVDPV